jgi:hypothetical protein
LALLFLLAGEKAAVVPNKLSFFWLRHNLFISKRIFIFRLFQACRKNQQKTGNVVFGDTAIRMVF